MLQFSGEGVFSRQNEFLSPWCELVSSRAPASPEARSFVVAGKQQRYTGPELLVALLRTRRIQIEGWSLNLDEHGIWITNPYGIDCGLSRVTISSCEGFLNLLATDVHEREWF